MARKSILFALTVVWGLGLVLAYHVGRAIGGQQAVEQMQKQARAARRRGRGGGMGDRYR